MQVMRMWPFRNLIVRSGAGQVAERPGLQAQQAFYFGGTEHIMQAARMSNRLTGYVYLLDAAGRMRWQASGPAQVCCYLRAGTLTTGNLMQLGAESTTAVNLRVESGAQTRVWLQAEEVAIFLKLAEDLLQEQS